MASPRGIRMTAEALKEGYDRAYHDFYRWSAIARASLFHGSLKHQAKHFFYAAGWKKLEPLWNWIIRTRHLSRTTPLLEAVLSRVSGNAGASRARRRESTEHRGLQLAELRDSTASCAVAAAGDHLSGSNPAGGWAQRR